MGRLRKEVLLELTTGAIRSVTYHATKFSCTRPSLSRTLHDLKSDGLVYKTEGAWQLTPKGTLAANELATAVVKITPEIRREIQRAVIAERAECFELVMSYRWSNKTVYDLCIAIAWAIVEKSK